MGLTGKLMYSFLILIISFIQLCGCASIPTPAATQTSAAAPVEINATQTPGFTPTQTTAPEFTPTLTETPAPNMTASPTPSATLAPAPKSPVIEALTLKQQCLPIEAELPDNVRSQGKAIIWDSAASNSYFWNIATKQREDIPGYENEYEISVSPDHRWLAYSNPFGYTTSILDVTDSQLHDIPINLYHYFRILRWVSNQTFLIYDYHDVYLVDKDQGIQGKVMSDNNLPGPISHFNDWKREFDPTLKRLVYDNYYGFNLLDLESGKVIQTIPALNTPSFYDIVWTADGNYFYMLVDPGKTKVPGNEAEKLLIMNRNGIPIEWLGIKGEKNQKQWFLISGLSVSPDQHYVSFWLAPFEEVVKGSYIYKWSLVVIDMFSKTSKDYCLPQTVEGFIMAPPLWSLDGTQLLVESGTQESQGDTVLVDVTTEKAYLVTKDAIPVDWMIDK